ncbi:MAG: hypothetical protein JWP81_1923 [Ferruginibacter sp.]|nr:hypothetical protein [Ferruginibacter sp.]
MKRILNFIGRVLNGTVIIYYKGFKTSHIIIYDDFFPNPVTGFRLDEFTYLVNNIKSSVVLIDSEKTYSIYGYPKEARNTHLAQFFVKGGNGISKNRIRHVAKLNNINCKLVYVVFLRNLTRIFKYLKFFKIPFVITLYPGGGFTINDEAADARLAILLQSDLCKGVIVNQSKIKQYLIDKQLCNKEKIKLIFGLPISSNKLTYNLELKKYYPINRQQLNICFVGAKNSQKGMDKGYDLFIDVAKLLKLKYDFVSFHVVGGFDELDIPVQELKESVTFHGKIEADELSNTLVNFDIIVAPNRPNILSKGAFDGFPVGCCIEASLVGCCVITTDPMEENKFLYDENTEICIVKANIESILARIESLIAKPDQIRNIGKAGMLKTQQLYSEDTQLKERVSYLNQIISKL